MRHEPSTFQTTREFQDALVAAIRLAQQDDAFAPVTIVAASAAQGWALRRQVASRFGVGSAVLNLAVMTLDEFMVECAKAAGVASPKSDRLLADMAAQTLLQSHTSALQVAAGHRQSAEMLTRVAQTLAWVDLGAEAVARAGRETYPFHRAPHCQKAKSRTICHHSCQ